MADEDDAHGISLVARRFIAGQPRHARSVYALLAPTVNCMKHRRTHTFSATNLFWGIENRSALVRVKGAGAAATVAHESDDADAHGEWHVGGSRYRPR